jgi:hypothetical protein
MEFPYEKIVKLAERIGNMRDKKYKNDLKKIKKIIEENNSDISMTKNNNGYFLPDFESYSYQTYIELTNFFEKLDLNNKSSDDFSDSNTTKKNEFFSEKNDEQSERNQNKKLKYTNSENHILNKIKYEKALKKHQSECNDEDEKNNTNGEHLKIRELEKIFKKTDSQKKDDKEKEKEKEKEKIEENIISKKNEENDISEKIFKKHKKQKEKSLV